MAWVAPSLSQPFLFSRQLVAPWALAIDHQCREALPTVESRRWHLLLSPYTMMISGI
jgi:hypothetical protein